MKYLFALLLSIGIIGSAQAGTGFFYDPERDGEGIIVTIEGDTLAFGLFTFWDGVFAKAPYVSPPPPPPPVVPANNYPLWFVGSGAWIDEASVGEMYMSMALDYPFTEDNSLDYKRAVGTYLLLPDGEGYYLTVDCYYFVLPETMYLCNNDYRFSKRIIGE